MKNIYEMYDTFEEKIEEIEENVKKMKMDIKNYLVKINSNIVM